MKKKQLRLLRAIHANGGVLSFEAMPEPTSYDYLNEMWRQGLVEIGVLLPHAKDGTVTGGWIITPYGKMKLDGANAR